ncbi:MAG: hypothetical protein A2Y41_07295 [Spirochaetes bacterium GWB1_36_13]|nr:MAG: hypothetical protein A2Y41_07295 [Spirochaetes bacterium GWB1_36_13]
MTSVLQPLKINSISLARNELAKRKSFYPSMVHKVSIENKSLLLESLSVEDYLEQKKRLVFHKK